MKFSVMTAILLIVPTLTLAHPVQAPNRAIDLAPKKVAFTVEDVLIEKKRARLHVIERVARAEELRDLCASPTKMLRHACVKGEGGSSARRVTETGRNDRTGRQTLQSQNSRLSALVIEPVTPTRFFQLGDPAGPVTPSLAGPVKPPVVNPTLPGVKPTHPDPAQERWLVKPESGKAQSHARKG